jgi:hypothetical protein
MTFPATHDDDHGETVRFVPVSQILTDAARERTRALQDHEWQAWRDEIMRRICA